MSLKITRLVWERSTADGSAKLVLLALADFANDDGEAWPSIQTLASMCRMSGRNVNHILVSLRAKGEVEIGLNEGPAGVNRYRICLPVPQTVNSDTPPASPGPLKPASPPTPEAGFTPEEAFTLKPVAQTPEEAFRTPLKPASDEPSMNHQEPSSNTGAPRSRTETAKASGKAKKSGTLKAEDLVKEGVSRQHADDWLKTRKAALTPTAWGSVKQQAEVAGLTPGEAVRIAAERAWRGFRAEWLQGRGSRAERQAVAEPRQALLAEDTFESIR